MFFLAYGEFKNFIPDGFPWGYKYDMNYINTQKGINIIIKEKYFKLKTLLQLFTLCVSAASTFAQDVITLKNGNYLANYGQGTMCVTVKSDKIDSGCENNHYSIMTVFQQLISLFEMNHRNALINYLQAKGYETKEEDNILTGSKNGKVITAEFDNLFRLTKLNG